MEEGNGVDELLKDLERIPKNIESRILIKEISREIAQELGKKLSL
jgi:hypothetical protein